MPNQTAVASPMPDPAARLMQNIREHVRSDMVNHYTCLSPRRSNDGVQTMTVKDARTNKTLTVTVREDAE